MHLVLGYTWLGVVEPTITDKAGGTVEAMLAR
jgi:hypothetical protein